MADATTISVLIKARDQASAAFRNVEDNAGKMAQGIARNRRAIGMGMLAMGTAITGVGVVMAKTASTFDAKMREVNSLIGLSQVEFQKLTDDTLEMSSAIGVDAVKASEALYQAISAGVPKENVIDFMTIASKAAIAGVTDTETAVDGLTTVMNAFKMDVSEAQRVADIMFVAVKGGKTTFDELSASMFYVAPIAAALGVEFEAIGGAAATMTKQGMPTKQAFTALRQTFVALMKPTAEMENALDQVGFASGRALLDAHGLQAGLQLLMTGTSLTEAEMTKAFGSVEAFGAVLALTGQNASEAAEDLRKSYESAGAATAAFDIINEGAARQFEIMQARLKVVSIELGNILLPIVIAITGKVSDMATKFRDFYQDHPTLVKWVGLIGVALGGLMIVLGALALMLPGLIAGFTVLWAVAFAPATAVILAVTAAIVAGIVIWKKWEDASVKVKIAMLALGAAILFAMGPLGLLVAAVFAGIAIWKNWDLVVSKVKKLLADTAKEILAFARLTLVALKSVTDFTGGLFGTSDALQDAINSLDNMSASMDDWSNETTRKTEEVAEAWGAMEDGHHSTAGAVATQNAQMSDSTSDAAKVIEKALGDAGVSYDQLATDAGNSVATQKTHLKDFSDQVTYFAELNASTEREIRNKSREEYLQWIEDGLEAADRRREEEARIAQQIADSWKGFKQSQDVTMKALSEANIGFTDLVGQLAKQHDISVTEMADRLAEEGIGMRDTWGLIQKYGAEGMAGLINEIETSTQTIADKMAGLGRVMSGPNFTDKAGAALGFTAESMATIQGMSIADKIEMAQLDALKNFSTSQLGDLFAQSQGDKEYQDLIEKELMRRDAPMAEIREQAKATQEDYSLSPGQRQQAIDVINTHLRMTGQQIRLGDDPTSDAFASEKAREISRGVALAFGKDTPVGRILRDFGSGEITTFARGGIVSRPTLGLVGEAGPEAIIPLGRGGRGMGTTNNFHFHGAVYGVEDLREAVVEAVRDHAISGGFSGVFAEA